ncbi:MAG: tetratricopeptide repeat protein [Armatimonadota bacterium]|jgi:Flp pilus assembly protein TadD
MRGHIPALILIVVVAGGLFANALGAIFLWDDNKIILENTQIRDPARVVRAFGLDYWRRIRAGEGPAADRHYRPVVELSFAADYAIWESNGVGYHLTGILIHAATSVLVYLLAYQVLRARLGAALCGLLFAAHPIHVEAIAWTKCRSDLLALLFMLASLLLYLRWLRGSSGIHAVLLYVASLGSFALALGSKASAVVLPALAALYLCCFIQRPRRAMAGLLPFAGIAVAFVAFYAVLSSLPDDANVVTPYQRLLTATAVTGAYLRLLVVPTGLCLVHDFGIPRSPSEPNVLLALPWIVASVGGVAAAFRRSRPALFALAWLLVAMVPISTMPQGLRRLVADSRAYAPSVGFCLLVALLLTSVPALGRAPSVRRALQKASLVLAALLLAAYAGLTIDRNVDWTDHTRLFAHTLARNPRMYDLRIDLASHHIMRGELELAIPHLRHVVAHRPDHARALRNLARACRYTGRYDEAIIYYSRGLRQQPRDPDLRVGLGIACAETGRYAEAIEQFEAALRLDPLSAETHYSIGVAHEMMGNRGEAVRWYRKATELAGPAAAMAKERLAELDAAEATPR